MADGTGRRRGRRDGAGSAAESPELRRLRRRIDALDRRIVEVLNERARLGREVGRVKAREGRRTMRDLERERTVLLRIAMTNEGPLPQADLLAIYRRLMAATRALEARDRATERAGSGRSGSEHGAGGGPAADVTDPPDRRDGRSPDDGGR